MAIPVVDGKAGNPVVMSGTAAAEYLGRLSPDGKWLAYQSNESGQFVVYVRAMAGSGGRWQVSEGSGNNPYWTRDGKEIVYRPRPEGPFYGVDVDLSSGTPRFGRSHTLFEHTTVNIAAARDWGASAEHDRFAFVVPEQETKTDASSVVIVTNWFARLKKLATKAKD